MNNTCFQCFRDTLDEQGICTACGYDSAKNRERFPLALPEGSILYGQYIIGKVLGQGGFGITYLAQDYQTKALVAIKEFFPGAMATRTGTTVTPYSGVQGENFTYGRTTFLDEAKTMAEFNGNPNIAGVQLYFEENGTAYFVMEYLDGCSFGDYIASRGGRLSWEDTAAIMFPVLEVLGQIHEKGVVHRDVSPDNIHITADGTVKLLDFGAARHSLGNVSQSLDVVVKHGFAPKEQYSRRGRQGPYTDVYAASATIYYALTGVKPDESLDRAENDTMPPPSVLNARIGRAVENALMKGLSVDAKDRYQSAAELKNALSMNLGSRIIEKRVDNSGNAGQTAIKEKKRSLPKWLIPVGMAAVLLIGLAIGFGLNKTPIPAEEQEQMDLVQTGSLQKVMDSIQIDSEQSDTASLPTYLMTSRDILQDVSAEDVHTVSFRDTLDGAPANAWDISAEKNSSILAWMDGNDLIVAANGIISLPQDSSYLFADFANVTRIDFGDHIDTSNVTDMIGMFDNCNALTTLDVSGFDTSNVTDMMGMFEYCSALTTLDVSGFDTSNVTDMAYMFDSCSALTTLDVSGFDTSNVTDMAYMFDSCSALTTLDVSGFDTSNVTDMIGMFDNCNALTTLDVSGFDTSNVTDMSWMFYDCNALTTLDLSGFDTSNVTDMSDMFDYCSALTTLDLSGFDTSNVTDMIDMFLGCDSLTTLICEDEKILEEYRYK